MRTPDPPRPDLAGYRRPLLIAAAVRLVGLVVIVQALLPLSARHRDELLGVVSFSGLPLPDTVTAGLFFVLLASGLAAGKRVAWAGLVALLVLDVGLLVPGAVLDVALPETTVAEAWGWWGGHALASAAVLAVVLPARGQFVARTGAHGARRALLLLGGSLGTTFVAGWALIAAVDHQRFADRTSLRFLLDRVLHTGDTVPPGLPYLLRLALGLIGAATVLTATYLWLRPARLDRRLSEPEEARLRQLLDHTGELDSLGYFSLRRDKATVFSASGKAATCYRVVGGVSLAAGDPIGDPEAWPGAIARWRDEARRNAWIPAVLGASERGARAYQRAGLRAWNIGAEAVVPIERFTLSGRAMRGVRQAVARVERAGYTVHIRRLGQVPATELAAAVGRAEGWRDGPIERGYSMALGRLGDPTDADYVLVQCHDRDGQLTGLLGFVPWGADGLSLDLMRRDRGADNGLVEFMVARLAAAAPSLGIVRLSLNFAMFREVFAHGERIGAGPVLRSWLAVLRLASRWWQIESLYRANEKFRPDWVPRFLCYERARDLPRIAYAAGTAEGFITLSRRGQPTARERAAAR